MQNETMDFDTLIIGAGPAGLSAAIRLKQLDAALRVCVLEKGAEVGAHILSGAVIETRALDSLLPNWCDLGAPIDVKVTEDHFLYLSQKRAWRLPTPAPMKNHGNFIVSLGQVTRWLGEQAEALGVEIYPGFAGCELLFENNKVVGVATNALGIAKNGEHKETYQPSMHLMAEHILIAEGAHGSLSKQLIKHYSLRKHAQPQTYAIGLKEIWRVPEENHSLGTVVHTMGWPLEQSTYGGSFIYHAKNSQLYFGLVVGLDYQNPYLNPFQELQRLKTHPAMQSLFTGGERIEYGARCLNEGGWQSLPQLSFPGGALIGCSAGTLNVPKIKGTHTAMQSGIIAAECIFEKNLEHYDTRLKQSWVGKELKRVRNIRPGFKKGLLPGLINAALETYLFRGKMPWTLSHPLDHETLKPSSDYKIINYPKPDGKLTFDKLSSVYLSNVYHEEDQPCHLVLKDPTVSVNINYKIYASPETHYCPAGVYEFLNNQLQINAQNCIHCKTCDIKDPKQNINWVPPEGGGGPNYSQM